MPEYTPGPWEKIGLSIFQTEEGGRQIVHGDGVKGRSLVEREANARLMAAAPEMLEALSGIFQAVDSNGMPDHMKDGADSVRVNIPSLVLQQARRALDRIGDQTQEVTAGIADELSPTNAPCSCMPGYQLCQVAETFWASYTNAYRAHHYEEANRWHMKYDEHIAEVEKALAGMARESEVKQ